MPRSRVFFLATALAAVAGAARANESSPQELFERRILPIFRSPRPSSCVQCHLAGVDLKNYILPSHEKTFRSLRDQGLIDLDAPAKSKILKLIHMGAAAKSPVHAAMRAKEYEAFAAWVRACCADPALRDAPKLAEAEWARPPRPDAVVRHARKDRVLAGFEDAVWAQRFRCASCHSKGGPNHARLVKEHGPGVSWMKPTAEATLEYLAASKLIDTDRPEKSLLLLKPLAEVKHGGGKKMEKGDLGYQAYRAWLEDYAAVTRDRYRTAGDLPRADPRRPFGSQVWLRIAHTPPAWADKLVQVRIYGWDREKRAWEKEPVAVSDRRVWGKGEVWQHNLILLAERGSPRVRAWEEGPATLPAGRYLLKAYVDKKDRLEKDWRADLGDEEFAGQCEVRTGWPVGFWKKTVLEAARFRLPK